MATKTKKNTKTENATKSKKTTRKNVTSAKATKKVEQKILSSLHIHKSIQAFVFRLKGNANEVSVFKDLLIPSILAIVLVGVSVSTGGLLPAGLIGGGLFGDLFLKKIFEGIGTNVIWEVIQTLRNSKRREPSVDDIVGNHELITAISLNLKSDLQFQASAGKLLDLTDGLSVFTDKAREISYDEIIQGLCNELIAHPEILKPNEGDLGTVLKKNWNPSSLGYRALYETLNYAKEIRTAEEIQASEVTQTNEDRKDQITTTSVARSESGFVGIIKRLRDFPLPMRVLLWMLSWIASILIAVLLLHFLTSYSSSWCNCNQFSLIPMLTSTPIAVSTATLMPTTTFTATATITLPPTMTHTMTPSPTSTIKPTSIYKLQKSTYLFKTPGSKDRVIDIYFTPESDVLIGYFGKCAKSANEFWLNVSFSYKLANGTRKTDSGWVVSSTILNGSPQECSVATPSK